MENKFEYTYSSYKNEELEKIRKKYVSQTTAESKLEQLKKLDRSIESEGMAYSLAVGIAGSLILGTGMCCTMIWTDLFILGIIIGIAGMILCGYAYPLYKSTVAKRRAEIAPQILKLSNEIENEICK
ncbi:MAG: hypothetical protein IJ368_01610 [Oscillospiraceae bacterium]|nr:hypothetical protein [Oscillospiraceae bacterium]